MVFGLVMTFGSALSAAIAAVTVTGTVRDSSGAPVAAAEVALLTPELAGIARTTTNPQGRFTFAVPAPGTYLLIVRAKAFDEVQRAFTAIDGQESAIDQFARHVESDQGIEIARMQEMLAERAS